MKVALLHSHHGGKEKAEAAHILNEVLAAFNAPAVKWGGKGSGERARDHVVSIVEAQGWSQATAISAHSALKIMCRKGDFAFHLQTGNISRVPYDLLKFQHLFLERRISLAIYGVPTAEAARACGKASNIAAAERLVDELNLFDRIITVPICLIGFN